MSIKTILNKRSSLSNENNIDQVLNTLLLKYELKVSDHLKKIMNVLPEFDIHDESHSKKVLENIEKLIGENKLEELSSYELFLLYMSSYLHDAAMAISDWEINVLLLTEGTDKYFINNASIKNDLKSPLSFSKAKQIIESNKQDIYIKFDSDVKEWMFSPSTENELIDYLSNLLREYQEHRNGFGKELRNISSKDEFEELNNFIRTDYIRDTHHLRVEKYIKNMEKDISNTFQQKAWGKQLVNHLAQICRSHGEDISFIEKLPSNIQYSDVSTTNIQFISIMLRLGDIIHFSFDRAPVQLRSSKQFKSEYSFQQWSIKNEGVNYTIVDGKINFMAYCEEPDNYFKLHQYIDWIEFEIQNYHKYIGKWDSKYKIKLDETVNRGNITNNESKFIPKRGLSFSLSQRKIIELLMGVGLYKDKYACLRELYQNSLDACKCMISRNKSNSIDKKGLIEFGLIQEIDQTYLYCLDNGIGMDEHIIEKYLLNIGNSYYKSPEFFKNQSKWGGNFTPTSQFGIGILSCFMIGDSIKIISKMDDTKYVSCNIDGPHENIYYSSPTDIEKETIGNNGTLIKICLNNKVQNELNNEKLKKIGILLLNRIDNYIPDEFRSYIDYNKNWDKNLYKIITNFLYVIPKNINVNVKLKDKNVSVLSKPLLLDINEESLDISMDDLPFIHYLNNERLFENAKNEYENMNKIISYPICVKFKDIEFRTTLNLPINGFNSNCNFNLSTIVPEIISKGFTIDGIKVNSGRIHSGDDYISLLENSGILNFTGDIRPQLTVDRLSIVEWKDTDNYIATNIIEIYLKEIMNIVHKHISEYKILGELLDVIWDYILKLIAFADSIFIEKLALSDYGNIEIEKLNRLLENPMSIKNFLLSDELTLKKFNFFELDLLIQRLIITKLINSSNIELNKENIKIKKIKESEFKITKQNFYNNLMLFPCSESNNNFDEYDLISNMYPFINKNLLNALLVDTLPSFLDSSSITISNYSNSIGAIFEQNPLLVDDKLGLYYNEQKSFGREIKNNIRNFEKKRSKFWLIELNDYFYREKDNNRYMLTAFLAPINLSKEETIKLEEIKDEEPTYYYGVKNGWSLLITGKELENIIIIPGKCTRRDLVQKISDSFWEEYKENIFKFINGTLVKDYK